MSKKGAARHSLFQKMISYLQEQFAALPDCRVGKNQFISMKDIGLSAFSVFFNQCPSFLEHQRLMERRSGKNNARSLFGIEHIPSDNHVRTCLDPVAPSTVFPVFHYGLRQVEEAGLLQTFRYLPDQLGGHFIFTAKPDSHKTLYEWLTPLRNTKHITTLSLPRRKGKKKWVDTYQFINQVPLRDSDDALQVSGCELTTTDAAGKVVYRNSFITDHKISPDNVIELVNAGRARWKTENENHNTLKTKGYHLSHNLGHGKRYLAQFLASLNVLTYLFHTALNVLDAAYRALRLKTGRRDLFFQSLAVLTRFHYFASWGALMLFMLHALEINLADTR